MTGSYSQGRCEPGSGFANIPSNFKAGLAAAEFVVWGVNNMGNFHHRDEPGAVGKSGLGRELLKHEKRECFA